MITNAIDLFCGIGGLTHGLELAGIDVIAGFDIDASCEFAYKANNNAEFFCRDIRTIKAEEINSLFNANSVKILVGCAPCQPFSRYSYRYKKNRAKDDKWSLLYAFLRIIVECSPDIISMENVPNLLHEKVFSDFALGIKRLGYYIQYQVVYCPDYGVPQKRKRLVLLASKLGKISLIPPIYSAKNYRTVRMAIGDLPPIKAGETYFDDSLHHACALSPLNKIRISQSIPGGTWRDWDENLRLKCHKKGSGVSYPSVYGRMKWDEPSPTITTQFYGYGNGRFGHPEQNRAISFREGALLQSFPKNYIFTDKNHPIRQRSLAIHIGNAVPVDLGKAIGVSIKQHMNSIRSGE